MSDSLIVPGLLVVLGLAVLAYLHHRRSRAPRRGMSHMEVADAQRPFAEISVWPSRAPRNGSTDYEPTE